MYFTMSAIKSDPAAQLTVITANELGERVLLGEKAHVAFETVVIAVKDRLKRDPRMVAAQLLAEDAGKIRSALKIGLKEIVTMFGGEDKVMGFFRQVSTPRHMLRFDSIGGISEDITLAKNRAAMMASGAVFERFLNPQGEGVLPAERLYIDFMKSVRRSLDSAVGKGEVKAQLAKEMMTDVEFACLTDPRKGIKEKIISMQVAVSEELYEENRQRVYQRYANLYAGSDASASAEKGRDDPAPN